MSDGRRAGRRGSGPEPDPYRRTIVVVGVVLALLAFAVMGYALWSDGVTTDTGGDGTNETNDTIGPDDVEERNDTQPSEDTAGDGGAAGIPTIRKPTRTKRTIRATRVTRTRAATRATRTPNRSRRTKDRRVTRRTGPRTTRRRRTGPERTKQGPTRPKAGRTRRASEGVDGAGPFAGATGPTIESASARSTPCHRTVPVKIRPPSSSWLAVMTLTKVSGRSA
ncbi:hypothetical protein [Halalkalicoccus salilacus]|uniref:hypothetical protein n=1 Tax=Halalkalicoccus sp. GCM10025704 TaxID=3252662 RepID=UPI0036127079